ncbi:hypothetical protein EPN96_10380 [bacterium]|nr:MAG: hypothetical protein EPN96_10380 [bacterium]
MRSRIVENIRTVQNVLAIISIAIIMYASLVYGNKNKDLVAMCISVILLILASSEIVMSKVTEQIIFCGLAFDKKQTPTLYMVIFILFILLSILSIVGIFVYWGSWKAV